MAIPQGRLSTTVVQTSLLEPEGDQIFDLVVYERGPTAIEDVTLGLLYQNWTFTWDAGTGDFTATPQDTGSPVVVLNAADVEFFRATFDQVGRVYISYMTSVSSFLFWYDTQLGMTTTDDLGSGVLTPSVYLDDKRDTQSSVNDILLWWIEDDGGGQLEINMSRQRDRFQTAYIMGNCTNDRIQKVGLSSGLRIELHLIMA